jgi:hypothetical protein
MKALKAFLGVSLLCLSLGLCAADLQLNGKGIRKRVIFEVYEISLYLPKKTNSSEEAITGRGEKSIDLRMLRDVSAEQFSDALADGIRANHSEAEAKALEPQIRQLVATMAEVKEAKKGMAIALEWNGKSTQVAIDGKPAGVPIEGEEFYRALLRIWLGDKPVQDDLKKALLGRPG